MNKITLLKIKIKSLAEEQRIIRREENKCRSQERWAKGKHLPRANGERAAHANNPDHQMVREVAKELRHAMTAHRKGDLRPMLRAAQLAYGYMRGTPYYRIERTTHAWTSIPVADIRANITRFGGDPDGLDAWLTATPPAEEVKQAA